MTYPPFAAALSLWTLAACLPAGAQLTNPLPTAADSGLEIEVEEWLTIPASSAGHPLARINHLKPAPGGARLFCNDMRGRFWVIANNQATAASEFLDLTDHFPRFIDTDLGRGFTSFAFHPEFAGAGLPGYGKFYTGHVETAAGSPTADLSGPLNPAPTEHGVITEWFLSNHAVNAITTGPDNFTRREILRIEFAHPWHGVQELAMDPNAKPGDDNYGCLFICVGDGGSVQLGLPTNIGRIDSPLGTILRILPVLSSGQNAANFTLSANTAYYTPHTNPFAAANDPTPGDGFGVVREMFAYGFRNPHRISWDTGGSGKMFCGNIGEHNVEEVEVIEAGHHYGWPDREGSFLFNPADPYSVYALPAPDTSPPDSPPSPSQYSYPAAHYDHGAGGNVAIVSGYLYRGSSIPELYGSYICGDISNGILYTVPESDLFLQQPAASGDSPGTLQTLGLRQNGTPTTFLNILGSSRADLRFGTDHANELYLLSKQNGAIYRVNARKRIFLFDIAFDTQANAATVSFQTGNGKTYQLWCSDDLKRWSPSGAPIAGDGFEASIPDPSLPDRRFYQVEEVTP